MGGRNSEMKSEVVYSSSGPALAAAAAAAASAVAPTETRAVP